MKDPVARPRVQHFICDLPKKIITILHRHDGWMVVLNDAFMACDS